MIHVISAGCFNFYCTCILRGNFCDQKVLRSLVFEMGLHCLHMSQNWGSDLEKFPSGHLA